MAEQDRAKIPNVNNVKTTVPDMNEEVETKPDDSKLSELERSDVGLQRFFETFFVGDVVITPPDKFWEMYIKNSENAMRFPAISLYPISYDVTEMNSFPQHQQGFLASHKIDILDDETGGSKGTTKLMSKFVKVMYMDIGYMVSVWAKTRSDALKCFQEILFVVYNHQEFPIYCYEEKIMLPFKVDAIGDSSQFGMTASQDVMYRYTVDLTVSSQIFETANFNNVIDRDFTVIEDKKVEEDFNG